MTQLPPLSLNASLRFDVVLRLIPPDVVDVLEVGCGLGAVAVRLAQRFRYVGLEPDVTSYAVAAQRVTALSEGGEVRNGDLSALKEDELFDLVCAFEVLEHIEDDREALLAWVARLRPGGSLILSTPAYQSRFGPADTMAGHFRRYDPQVMATLLRDRGLVDVRVVLYGMPLGYALEAGRNAVGRRRNIIAASPQKVAVSPQAAALSMEARTSASGRLFQPGGQLAGAAIRIGTLPFRIIQRAFPRTGTGLVAYARKPVRSATSS